MSGNSGGGGKRGRENRLKMVAEKPPTIRAPDTQVAPIPKVQPTQEQIRLAQMIEGPKSLAKDLELKQKIQELIELTGKPQDVVAVAMHDCDNDAEKAAVALLEGDGEEQMGKWETTNKKKKKQTTEGEKKEKSLREEDEKGDSGSRERDGEGEGIDEGPMEGRDRGRGRLRGPPRLRFRGRGGGFRREARPGSKEGGGEEEATRGGMGSERGRSRGRRGVMNGPRRGGGGKMFQGRGGSNPSMFLGSIDTWSNSQAEGLDGSKKKSTGDLNISTWDDSFPAAEDWDNEEWSGSLRETKVFTPSVSSPAPASAPSVTDATTPLMTTTSSSSPASIPPPLESQPSNGQVIDLQALLRQKPQESNRCLGSGEMLERNEPRPMTMAQQEFLSQFTGQKSTSSSSTGDPLKPSSVYVNSSDVYSKSTSTGSRGMSGYGLGTDSSRPATQGKPPSRLSKPRQTKIPSSAVEMPDEAMELLDVQFGGLEFGTESSALDILASSEGITFVGPDDLIGPTSSQVSDGLTFGTGKSKSPGSGPGEEMKGMTSSYGGKPPSATIVTCAPQPSSQPPSSHYQDSMTPSSYPTSQGSIAQYEGVTSGYQVQVTETSPGSGSYSQASGNPSYTSGPYGIYGDGAGNSYVSGNGTASYKLGSGRQERSGSNTSVTSSQPLHSATSVSKKKIESLANQYDSGAVSAANGTDLSSLPPVTSYGVVNMGMPSSTAGASKTGMTTATYGTTPDGSSVPLLGPSYIMSGAPFHYGIHQPLLSFQDMQLLQSRIPQMQQAPPSHTRSSELKYPSTTMSTGVGPRGLDATGSPGHLATSQQTAAVVSQAATSHTAAGSFLPSTATAPATAFPAAQYAYIYHGGLVPGTFPQYHQTPPTAPAAAIYPVPSAASAAHGMTAAAPLAKANAYGQANFSGSSYDHLAAVTSPDGSDYTKGYGSSSGLGSKPNSSGGSPTDISSMYHKKVSNSYEKYTSGGGGSAYASAAAAAYPAQMFIPTLHGPHQQHSPLQIHPGLHQEAQGSGHGHHRSAGAPPNKPWSKGTNNYWS